MLVKVFQAVLCTVCRAVCRSNLEIFELYILTFYMCNKEVHLLVIRT